MPMSRSKISYIDEKVLRQVEERIRAVLHDTHALAVLLIDRSGVVLSCAGDPPLHPEQLGALASGIFSAMSIMIKASRTDDFVVHIPGNQAHFQFQSVDDTVFLCAFYSDEHEDSRIRDQLKELARHATGSLSSEQSTGERLKSVSFIEEKLNELFDD